MLYNKFKMLRHTLVVLLKKFYMKLYFEVD